MDRVQQEVDRRKRQMCIRGGMSTTATAKLKSLTGAAFMNMKKPQESAALEREGLVRFVSHQLQVLTIMSLTLSSLR